jgi:hypothetical protein
VLEYARTLSTLMVQRRFLTKFGKDPPVKNGIKQWYEKLQRDGCLCITKCAGRPGPLEERVECVREAFQCSACKSTNQATTLFISKMGLCHTTTTSSAVTSISISHNVGSDARLPMTRRCFAGHHYHLI